MIKKHDYSFKYADISDKEVEEIRNAVSNLRNEVLISFLSREL